jgi:hypothetical protein
MILEPEIFIIFINLEDKYSDLKQFEIN